MQQAAAAGELFYEHQLLQPYLFFDVRIGKDERRGSGSIANLVSSPLISCSLVVYLAIQHGPPFKGPSRVIVSHMMNYQAGGRLLEALADLQPGQKHMCQPSVKVIPSLVSRHIGAW